MATDFTVKLWGVRGSIATPGIDFVRYGGNTTCLEVMCGKERVILDMGTGAKPLGDRLAAEGGMIDADILMTHTHLDHIYGLPFFKPAYNPENQIRMWAGHLPRGIKLREAIGHMMTDPLFPVPIDWMRGLKSFNDFKSGDVLELKPTVTVQTTAINHPNGATAYRINHGQRSMVLATDIEHGEAISDKALQTLCQDTDLLIYDATYTDEDYPKFKGWGHSTWQEAIRLADRARVEKVVIFHHAPEHTDDIMDKIAHQAEIMRPGGVVVAVEGMVFDL